MSRHRFSKLELTATFSESEPSGTVDDLAAAEASWSATESSSGSVPEVKASATVALVSRRM